MTILPISLISKLNKNPIKEKEKKKKTNRWDPSLGQ